MAAKLNTERQLDVRLLEASYLRLSSATVAYEPMSAAVSRMISRSPIEDSPEICRALA